MEITARILYPEIYAMNPEGGLYVWVDPDEQSTLKIQTLLMGAPFDAENSTEYHATVLSHPGTLPVGAVMPIDVPCRARVTEIITWPDKHGTSTVVALLDSPSLQSVHAALLQQGLKHSFPDFRPHVTLGAKVESSAALRIWMDDVNELLSVHALTIGFDAKLKGATIAD